MGLLSLDRLRAHLQRILGNRGFDNVDIDEWLNLGQLGITGYIEFDDLKETAVLTTIDGTGSYSEPPRLQGIISMFDRSNETRIRKISLKNFPLHSDESGKPTGYARKGGAILLHPVPDGAYEVEVSYLASPAPIGVGGTSLDPQWDWGVLGLAAHYAFSSLGEDNRADAWLNRALAHIRSRMTDEEMEMGAEYKGGVWVARSPEQLD